MKNRDDYEGEVDADGNRHGRGICINKDGYLYEGWWKNDKYHGHGREIVGFDGSYYIGEWEEGKE